MKVLLDECVPRRLQRDLAPHEVRTVPEVGWAATKNGALLRLAAESFDVFVTVDQRLSYQQTVHEFDIAVVVMVARRTKLEFLRPLVPELLTVIDAAVPGSVIRVPSQPADAGD